MKIVTILVTVLGYGYVLCYTQSRCIEVENCVCQDYESSVQFLCSDSDGELRVELLPEYILIECLYDVNIYIGEVLKLIPKMNESFFLNDIELHVESCILPYTFSTISEKFPPIKTANFLLTEKVYNISKDFFEENSPLTDLTFNDPIIFAPVNMLRNLKNLQKVIIRSKYQVSKKITYIPSNLFEGNINLKICEIYLRGNFMIVPSTLFNTNEALEQVTIHFYHRIVFDDELLSNKKNLTMAELISFDIAKPVPNKTFRNSTNLKIIGLRNFGLTNLEP